MFVNPPLIYCQCKDLQHKPQLKEYAQVIVMFMQKPCRRPQGCDQARTPIPILDISSLTIRAVKRNRELRPSTSSLNVQRTFEKCEKILTDWMYNLQTRFFVLPNAFDVYCVTSKFGLLNVNDFSLINFISLNANFKSFNKNLT